ncbi:M20 family metallopeptidase [Puniceicoccales bacterium CK1056]|uniref:M20 family metallopeptidase n=1 Tax=Oceanipulchritudo coccoides TaxID=2706888 RepID=A0A6B2M3D0_9BACT|nr:M20 family metallopeptidase [Oceanipulchritudo coccoides]NDV62200.1 M20 family metallopeptidase [Oceanipulchritudo coccoides]
MKFDLKAFEEELKFLVNIDSGSTVIDGVNRVSDWFEDRFKQLGWQTRFVAYQPDHYGKTLFTWNGDANDLDLLIISHVDTVFPDKTAEARPFSIKDKRYMGPGVADMKAGCLMALHSIEQLEHEKRLNGNIGIIFNGEHELSCPTIRPFLEEKSKQAKVVVTTEPARADGSCVRQRKGILRYTIQFHGKSAHSGVDPENGNCAVTEMARMILRLRELDDPKRGINLNPGIVKGGVSINAVPDFAECRLDVRVVHMEDAVRLAKTIEEMGQAPTDPKVTIDVSGGITRPPMRPTARGDELIESMNEIGKKYGVQLKWTFSGGGSDASYASAFNIPTLCGLGPVGGGYHTDREYLEMAELNERMSIFRDFVEAIGNRQT